MHVTNKSDFINMSLEDNHFSHKDFISYFVFIINTFISKLHFVFTGATFVMQTNKKIGKQAKEGETRKKGGGGIYKQHNIV